MVGRALAYAPALAVLTSKIVGVVQAYWARIKIDERFT
jgi:hypothetical protein